MNYKKVVFLDRDGVLNYDPGEYTYKPRNFEINEGAVEALQQLKAKGYQFVVITNQGGIAKGIYDHRAYQEINKMLKTFFADKGISFLEVYYCPHHPITGNCICRKPDSLMVEKAIARFKIDPSKSYFIGDKDRDLEAGAKCGVKGIKIDVNDNLLNYIHQIP